MAKVRLMFVKAYKDRHGKARYYFRRRGFPSVSLPGDPASREFAEAYQAAYEAARKQLGEERTERGTFNALIAEYYETSKYTVLAEITRKTYRNVLERFREDFGATKVESFTPMRLDELLETMADRPSAQHTLRKVLRLVLKLAVRRHYIKVSPMDGLRLPRKAQKGFHTWTEDEIAAYEAKWPSGSRERLALAMLLFTAQRRSDVITMGRQHVKDSKIHVTQQKTGTRLWIPIDGRLKAELDQVAANQLTFLQTQYGKPFTAAGFGNWFRECAQAAGLKECTAHGLRKAASRRLAEAGCTPHEIMAVTGHKNLSEVTLYTQAADQERLARDAMQKAEKGNGVSTRSRPKRLTGAKSGGKTNG